MMMAAKVFGGRKAGEVQSAIRKFDANDQQSLDKELCELEGTPKKSRLGDNWEARPAMQTPPSTTAGRHP
jgi:hypothetical protein